MSPSAGLQRHFGHLFLLIELVNEALARTLNSASPHSCSPSDATIVRVTLAAATSPPDIILAVGN